MHGSLRSVLNATLALLLGGSALSAAATDTPRQPLTNADVIRFVDFDLAESVVLQVVAVNPSQFDLSPGAVETLRRAGVGDKVLAAMAASSKPPTRHLEILESGVYIKRGQAYALVDTEPVIWRGKISHVRREEGIGKLALAGRVENRSSFLRLNGPSELLVVCGPGEQPAEYQVLRADIKDDGREFRAEAVLKDGRLLGFASPDKEVTVETDNKFDLGVRILLSDLPRGEYALAPPIRIGAGQMPPPGKVYPFTIE